MRPLQFVLAIEEFPMALFGPVGVGLAVQSLIVERASYLAQYEGDDKADEALAQIGDLSLDILGQANPAQNWTNLMSVLSVMFQNDPNSDGVSDTNTLDKYGKKFTKWGVGFIDRQTFNRHGLGDWMRRLDPSNKDRDFYGEFSNVDKTGFSETFREFVLRHGQIDRIEDGDEKTFDRVIMTVKKMLNNIATRTTIPPKTNIWGHDVMYGDSQGTDKASYLIALTSGRAGYNVINDYGNRPDDMENCREIKRLRIFLEGSNRCRS